MGTVNKMRQENRLMEEIAFIAESKRRIAEMKLDKIKKAGFWTRFKWLFKGVKV